MLSIRLDFWRVFKSSLAISLPAVFALALVCSYCWRSHRSGPLDADAIRFPPQSHDFGILPALSQGNFTFTTRNTLADTLIIDHIGRSCGCTGAGIDASQIAPGQDLQLRTAISTVGHTGEMSSEINLVGHEGRSRIEILYKLHAVIEDIIKFPDTPDYISLGTWSLGEAPSERLIRIDRGKYPIQFDDILIESSSQYLSGNVKPISHNAWQIAFRLKAEDTLGTIGYDVKFKFLDQGKVLPEVVEKQAYVEWRGPVVASPPSLLFTQSRGHSSHQTIILRPRVTGSESGIPEIESIMSTSKNIVASFHGQKGLIDLDYTAPLQLGYDRGAVINSVLEQGWQYKIRVNYLGIVTE